MEFETLKLLLLLAWLDRVPMSEQHPLIIDAADSAADLARTTTYPRLLFPCLFAERVDAALEQERVRTRNYWGRLDEFACPKTVMDVLALGFTGEKSVAAVQTHTQVPG
jgi:hypothetical protein